jgi:serine/threonine-protein kinase
MAMKPESDRLAELFDELRRLGAEARRVRLAALREDDAALASQLASLLDAHDSAGDFLDSLDTDRAAELLEADEREAMPPRAGPFRLVGEIGRGGLGVVYRGERCDGSFEQEVAVKLVKRGMDSDSILRRFDAERRILASLEHAAISRIVDGGVLGDGRPWFAMEYIRGMPITQWCDRQGLGVNARIELFEAVCRAVQFAHARLVVHRDLKPANIHVSDDGDVKLLDFGIAKLLDPEVDGQQTLTVAGMRAMTPEYAAPEQVRGEPVSIATDVYALGVVLYELLAGRHPFRAGSTMREDLTRAICDTMPALPSTMVSGEHAEAIARARGSRPKALRRHLNGDLDNIVLKAMAKEPDRRYASVEALADDLARHREGLPVAARRDSMGYRSRRFLYRHRLGAAAAAAVLVSLVGGLGVALWQAREAREQAAEAIAQAQRAEQVSRFLTELFEVNDPDVNRGERMTARELLERGAERIDTELAGQPGLQAEMAGLIGDIHLRLGEYDRAESLIERALTLVEPKEDRLATAQRLRLRGLVDQRQGDYEQALRWYDQAESMLEPGDDPMLSIALHSARASTQMEQGNLAGAEGSYRLVIDRLEAELGPDAVEIAAVLNNYGYLLWKQLDRPEEAGPVFERGLELALQHHGEVHSLTSSISYHLGWYLSEQGDFERAEALLSRDLEVKALLWGEDSERFAHTLVAYGNFESDRSRPEAAIEAYEQAYEVYLARRGPDHVYPSYPLHNISLRYYEMGDFVRALDHAERCLQIRRRALDDGNILISSAQHARGRALAGLERYGEARLALTEALDIRRAKLPDGHRQTQETRLELLLADIAVDGAEPHSSTARGLLANLPRDSTLREEATERLRAAGIRLDPGAGQVSGPDEG